MKNLWLIGRGITIKYYNCEDSLKLMLKMNMNPPMTLAQPCPARSATDDSPSNRCGYSRLVSFTAWGYIYIQDSIIILLRRLGPVMPLAMNTRDNNNS